MNIIMKREIPITVYEVNMTVFISEKRPEILPIIQAVDEANEKKRDVIQYLSDVLFMGFPLKFAENILEELKLLNLVDENGLVTSRGKETLLTQNVMEPDEGSFQIKTVNDSLFPNSIIEVKQLNPNARYEIFSSKEKREENKIDIPNHILNQKGKRFKTLDSNSSLIDVQKIASRGSIDKRTKDKLEFFLTFEENTWKAEVRYGKRAFNFEISDIFDSTKVINFLLSSIHNKADTSFWRIPEKPSNLSNKEILSFVKDFQLKLIDIKDIGLFDTITLKSVSIFPENQECAEYWANKIFEETLSNYLTESEYNTRWQEIFSMYSELKNYPISIPPINEIIQEFTPGTKKYWFLQAPIDLRLGEVLAND